MAERLDPTPRYQFGPLERRGLILGLDGGQVAVLGCAAALALLALRALPAAAGGLLAILLMATAAAGALLPVAGRSPAAWLPLVLGYALRRLLGGHRQRSNAHLVGHLVRVRDDGSVLDVLPPGEAPAVLHGLQILEVETEQALAGVIKNARRHTYVAVLRVRGRSFGLLDDPGQANAARGWASVLAGYALASSPVSRLQWIVRTLPDDGREIARHFEERGHPGAPETARHVYAQALGQAQRSATRHECLLALAFDARRAWRQVRQAGQGNLYRGACALLLRELAALCQSLDAAGVTVEDVLGSRALAEVIRSAYEPNARPRLRLVHGTGPQDGPHPLSAWPAETVERFAHHEAGPGTLHTTYHVREWPRIEVGPAFLAPLLLDGTGLRTVSMTLEPVPAARAARELRRALASDVSDDSIRQRGGWLPSFRRQREEENVLRAERELADGHASYRFSGYVRVSASSEDELEAASAAVEQSAARSHLELERLLAQQARAFTYTLPLCEGLR